jgi:hypothetical protein
VHFETGQDFFCRSNAFQGKSLENLAVAGIDFPATKSKEILLPNFERFACLQPIIPFTTVDRRDFPTNRGHFNDLGGIAMNKEQPKIGKKTVPGYNCRLVKASKHP